MELPPPNEQFSIIVLPTLLQNGSVLNQTYQVLENLRTMVPINVVPSGEPGKFSIMMPTTEHKNSILAVLPPEYEQNNSFTFFANAPDIVPVSPLSLPAPSVAFPGTFVALPSTETVSNPVQIPNSISTIEAEEKLKESQDEESRKMADAGKNAEDEAENSNNESDDDTKKIESELPPAKAKPAPKVALQNPMATTTTTSSAAEQSSSSSSLPPRVLLRRNIQRPTWLTDNDFVTDYEFRGGAGGEVGESVVNSGSSSEENKRNSSSSSFVAMDTTTKSSVVGGDAETATMTNRRKDNKKQRISSVVNNMIGIKNSGCVDAMDTEVAMKGMTRRSFRLQKKHQQNKEKRKRMEEDAKEEEDKKKRKAKAGGFISEEAEVDEEVYEGIKGFTINWLKEYYEPVGDKQLPRADVRFDFKLYCQSHQQKMIGDSAFGRFFNVAFPQDKFPKIMESLPYRPGEREGSRYQYRIWRKDGTRPPLSPETLEALRRNSTSLRHNVEGRCSLGNEDHVSVAGQEISRSRTRTVQQAAVEERNSEDEAEDLDEESNRTWLCEACGYLARSRILRNRHLVTHEVELKFACCICSTLFDSQENLMAHLKTHNGAGIFLCPEPECGGVFQERKSMDDHVLARHPQLVGSSKRRDDRSNDKENNHYIRKLGSDEQATEGNPLQEFHVISMAKLETPIVQGKEHLPAIYYMSNGNATALVPDRPSPLPHQMELEDTNMESLQQEADTPPVMTSVEPPPQLETPETFLPGTIEPYVAEDGGRIIDDGDEEGKERVEALEGFRSNSTSVEIDAFNRDVAEALTRIEEKLNSIPETVGSDVNSCEGMLRALEAFEKDLLTLIAPLQSLIVGTSRLSTLYPTNYANIVTKQETVLELCNTKLTLRKKQLQNAVDFWQFSDEYAAFKSYLTSLLKTLPSQPNLRDAESSQQLINEHETIRLEIDARSGQFEKITQLGVAMVNEMHPESAEVTKMLGNIKGLGERVCDAWERKKIYLDKLIDLNIFLRDARALETTCLSLESSLSAFDSNDGCSIVDVTQANSCMLRIEEFEKIVIGQEEKFRVLEKQGIELVKRDHCVSAIVAERVGEVKAKRECVMKLLAEKKLAVHLRVRFVSFLRDLDVTKRWVCEKMRNVEHEKSVTNSNSSLKVNVKEKHQGFCAEVESNRERVDELLRRRVEGDQKVLISSVGELRLKWDELLKMVNEFGKDLEEANVVEEQENEEEELEVQKKSLKNRYVATGIKMSQSVKMQGQFTLVDKVLPELKDAGDVIEGWKLEDSQAYYQFTKDYEIEKGWFDEKCVGFVCPFACNNLMDVEKHGMAFASVFVEITERLTNVVAKVCERGDELVRVWKQESSGSKKDEIENVKSRVKSLKMEWKKLTNLLAERQKKLRNAHEVFQQQTNTPPPSTSSSLPQHQQQQSELGTYDENLSAVGRLEGDVIGSNPKCAAKIGEFVTIAKQEETEDDLEEKKINLSLNNDDDGDSSSPPAILEQLKKKHRLKPVRARVVDVRRLMQNRTSVDLNTLDEADVRVFWPEWKSAKDGDGRWDDKRFREHFNEKTWKLVRTAIYNAVHDKNNRRGASLQAIKKYIAGSVEVVAEHFLEVAVTEGKLVSTYPDHYRLSPTYERIEELENSQLKLEKLKLKYEEKLAALSTTIKSVEEERDVFMKQQQRLLYPSLIDWIKKKLDAVKQAKFLLISQVKFQATGSKVKEITQYRLIKVNLKQKLRQLEKENVRMRIAKAKEGGLKRKFEETVGGEIERDVFLEGLELIRKEPFS